MTKRLLVFLTLALLTTTAALADVSLVERKALRHGSHTKAKPDPARRAASQKAEGAQALIDNTGVKYFINTDITSSTTSEASGAMSEASYTHAVAATTLNGGTTSSTLNDAYDGYNNLCLSLDHSIAPCEVDNENFVLYYNNGQATTECTGSVSGTNRQVVLPVQTVESLNVQMWRKVFVPDNDSFGRWLNYFKNTGTSPVTLTAVIANNLGSDSNTVVVTSSNGNATAEPTDTWVTSFQNYSGTTSSDPRLGHVFQNPGAPVQLADAHFMDGDDNPYWGYTFTLNPGETRIIMNFAVVQPSKAAAAAKSAQLAGTQTPAAALQCLSQAEQTQIANFALVPPIPPILMPTLDGVGLAVLGAGLVLAALAVLARRRRAA
jgi:hypothetical protein